MQLLAALLKSRHGTARKHPGISQMMEKIRRKYYFSSIVRYVRNWLQQCETCIEYKRINTLKLRPVILNVPECDMGPEPAMQIDLLPELPPSGVYENIVTALDVFSRYAFAYPVSTPTALITAKVIIDIITRHAYQPTLMITDKGSAFVYQGVCEVAALLGITSKVPTTNHAQTIGVRERTHATKKTSPKRHQVNTKNNSTNI